MMFEKIKFDKFTFSLFFLVISTFLLSQSYIAAISFAQTEPGSASGVTQNPTESILVCEFVQYCSNPVESNTNDNESAPITPITPLTEGQTAAETEGQTAAETEGQTAAETEGQTAAETEGQTAAETEGQTNPDSSEVIPDVTSNISLIMTPDLPGDLTEEDFQDPVNQASLAANETQQISPNVTKDNQTVIPENATVITPDTQIPLESTGENISMTIQNDNGTITTGSSATNQSEFADTISLNNLTKSIDDSKMPLNATAANETIDTTAANETIDTTAANETIDTTAANETIDTTAANETISPATSNIDQQDDSSIVNQVQPNSSLTLENQTAPPFFLDPLINPFKELFGIR
jgi:hypothetical protein